MSSFTGPVQVELSNLTVQGRLKCRLVSRFQYHVGSVNSTDVIDVDGVKDDQIWTDFGSIPWWARWLFPVFDIAAKACLLHDYLLTSHRLRTRAEIDAIFHEAMLVLGVPRWRAWVMWKAVRWQAYYTYDK